MTSYCRNSSLRAARARQATASCFPPFSVRAHMQWGEHGAARFLSIALYLFPTVRRSTRINARTCARAHTRHHGHANRLPCMNASIARDSRALKSGKPVG